MADDDGDGEDLYPEEHITKKRRLLSKSSDNVNDLYDDDLDSMSESSAAAETDSSSEELDRQEDKDDDNRDVSQEDSLGIYSDGEIRIEAFDMDVEYKSGIVDSHGNYTGKNRRIEDEFTAEDCWMEDYSSKEAIEEARLAKEEQNLGKNKKSSKPLYMLSEVLERLYYFIPKEKSIQETLVKYNELRKQTRENPKTNISYLNNAINSILNLCNILEQKGIEDVMNLKKNELESLYIEESIVGSKIENYESKVWQFKWFDNLDEIHETYSNYEMQYWKQTYFNGKVAVKRATDDEKEINWYHIDCLEFM